jgi:CBS domain-containing protein
MRVREGMSETVLTVGPSHTLREAATLMSQRNVGAAVVLDPDAPGPGIVTERDVLHSIPDRGRARRGDRRAFGPRHHSLLDRGRGHVGHAVADDGLTAGNGPGAGGKRPGGGRSRRAS